MQNTYLVLKLYLTVNLLVSEELSRPNGTNPFHSFQWKIPALALSVKEFCLVVSRRAFSAVVQAFRTVH